MFVGTVHGTSINLVQLASKTILVINWTGWQHENFDISFFENINKLGLIKIDAYMIEFPHLIR